MSHDEVREALRSAFGPELVSGMLDQEIDYLVELQYLVCSQTAEWRHHQIKPRAPNLAPTQAITRVVTRTYYKRQLHEIPYEADLARAQQEVTKALEDVRADEDRKLDAALRRRGITLPSITSEKEA